MGYLNLTVEEMHLALVEGMTTPTSLVQEAISLAKADKNNIFEAVDFENALKEATKIESVPEDKPFLGIPYLVKDNYSTSGIETTASSDVLSGYIPTFDAEVVSRLKKEGAIIIGKTTMDELAMGGTGTSGHKGATHNPYDYERIIGGSSCGSCAGVASGIVPFALGSDTGDSVRKPAGYGGICGFKPTWSRVSRFGLFPFAPSLDAVGYFARSVYDIALLTELLSGHDEKDMSSSYRPVEKYTSYLKKKNDEKKIGYFKPVIDAVKDKDIVDSFYKLVESLKKAGYKVEEYNYPQELLDALYPTYMIISCSEATSNDANLDGVKFGIKPDIAKMKTWEEYMTDARTRGFSSLIKRRFIIGSFSLLAQNQSELFRRAQKARRLIKEAMDKFYQKYDYLLLPCAKDVPGLIKDVSDRWDPHPNFVDNHLGIANLGGYPSLTLPLGYSHSLPYGINITGKQFDEGHVFALGQDIENITGLKNATVSNHGKGI
jgi:aspartyl-tRNA(Asn)/glutamyl-tRNA(Gln) amidotransferase subunit A